MDDYEVECLGCRQHRIGGGKLTALPGASYRDAVRVFQRRLYAIPRVSQKVKLAPLKDLKRYRFQLRKRGRQRIRTPYAVRGKGLYRQKGGGGTRHAKKTLANAGDPFLERTCKEKYQELQQRNVMGETSAVCKDCRVYAKSGSRRKKTQSGSGLD